jgi:signal transduction histidine kinase/CheY-like chemotaxis protein
LLRARLLLAAPVLSLVSLGLGLLASGQPGEGAVWLAALALVALNGAVLAGLWYGFRAPAPAPASEPTGALEEARAEAEQLRAARDDALAATAAKSDFLASVSHDMRTPLGGILGMTELLLQTPVSEQQRDFLKTLSRSAEALFALVNDLLDLSKIEAGKLELERIAFDPRELLQDALRVVALQAERKGLALRTEVEAALPRALVGDPARLRQVLLNLLSNAVKFTPRGEVAVAVGIGSEDDLLLEGSSSRGSDQGMQLRAEVARDQRALAVRFEVRDTGVGIPPEKQGRIFEPFAQADSSTTRVHGGTGLGLSISARLVERMGGRLTLGSAPGEGSTFAFTLPYVAAAAPAPRLSGLTPVPPTVRRPRAGPALRVLVAEDNAVNQEVFTLLLRKAGCAVELAGTGAEAVAAVERTKFDLVLMDLQMPEMDGLRAARLIRAREKAQGTRVPIVAVTANALSGERERCLAAGMDGYLAKPVRGPELLGLIDELVGAGLSPGPAAPAGGGGPPWFAALASSGFGMEDARKLARTFLDNAPARLARLSQAIADRDAAGVRRAAHLLKGSLSVFAAQQALEAATSLEGMGRSEDLARAPDALASLQAEVRALLESLKSFLHGPADSRIEN